MRRMKGTVMMKEWKGMVVRREYPVRREVVVAGSEGGYVEEEISKLRMGDRYDLVHRKIDRNVRLRY